MTMSDGDDISRVNEEEERSDQTDDDEDNPDEVPDTVLVPDFHAIVEKVRKTVKLFRMSLVRNDDNLQPLSIVSFGKEKAVFLDCKTR